MNDEQRKCVEHGSHGHNFKTYGEAGTGKSLTVMELTKELQKSGKTVQIICSTGVACDEYQKYKEKLKNMPSTVHSFLCLETAEAPFYSIVGSLGARMAMQHQVRSE